MVLRSSVWFDSPVPATAPFLAPKKLANVFGTVLRSRLVCWVVANVDDEMTVKSWRGSVGAEAILIAIHFK